MATLGLRVLSLSLLVLLSTPSTYATIPDGRHHGNQPRRLSIPPAGLTSSGPVVSRNGTALPPYSTIYTFDQLIDHDNPALGTFKQRFWYTTEFYEPGGPIILMTPGETNAEGYTEYLTNGSILGLIAQQYSGATVLLEHRFYGLSNPFPDLSVKSLRVHTIQQAIEDFVYFAEGVSLSIPGSKYRPGEAPWVLVGGSYSGALVSYIMVNKPGVFWAGYASSATVEAITDFYNYWTPIYQNMPQNCSADVTAVIAHIDSVFTSGTTSDQDAIKESFGMGELDHLDDVAGALRNNMWDWQLLQPTSGPGSAFYNFCDALEVKDGQVAPVEGWGLDHALGAWANYWKTEYLSYLCGNQTVVDCLGTYNATQSVYTNTTIDDPYRSWVWMACNELGLLQDGPPLGMPAVVTRLVQPAYDERTCQLMFPDAFPTPPIPGVEQTNAKYKGWDVRTEDLRLFFSNALRDPWRDATVSATNLSAPNPSQSVQIALSDAFHCSDLLARMAVDPTVGKVQEEGISAIGQWLGEWKSTA